MTERAILAGGCFGGMQQLLRRLPGVVSTSVLILVKCSSDVSNRCAVWVIRSTASSRNSQYSSAASSTPPLPFCRGTTNATSNEAQNPSAVSASAASRTSSCHGSSTSPADLANSTASGPALDAAFGRLRNRGGTSGGAAVLSATA